MQTLTRRTALRGAVAIGAAGFTAGALAAIPHDDAALLRDVARWLELETEVRRLQSEQRACEKTLPAQYRDAPFDPRGWTNCDLFFGANPEKMREYETAFVESGLGRVHDALKTAWNEQDPLTMKLLASEPATDRGKMALAGMLVEALAGFVFDNLTQPEDLDAKIVRKAKGILADAERRASGRMS